MLKMNQLLNCNSHTVEPQSVTGNENAARKSHVNVNCVAWNICGLNNKLGNEALQKYLTNFDVIFLSETWLTKRDLEIDDIFFGDYELEHVIRPNIHARAKRGSGGLSVLFNPEKVDVKLLESCCDHFLVAKVKPASTETHFTVISCYIPPKDTTFLCSACSGDYYNQLSNLIVKYRESNLVIGGDMNARTGALRDSQSK